MFFEILSIFEVFSKKMKNKFSIQENSYLRNIGKLSARTATKLRDEPRSIVIFSDDVVHTVILINDVDDDLSTVSFFDFDKAKEYVVQEILEHNDGSTSIDDILDYLEVDMFYEYGNTKYYIEEAFLM